MLVMEHIFLSKKAHFYASLDPIIQGNELCLSTEKKIVGWGLSYNYISQQNKSLTWYGQSSKFYSSNPYPHIIQGTIFHHLVKLFQNKNYLALMLRIFYHLVRVFLKLFLIIILEKCIFVKWIFIWNISIFHISFTFKRNTHRVFIQEEAFQVLLLKIKSTLIK